MATATRRFDKSRRRFTDTHTTGTSSGKIFTYYTDNRLGGQYIVQESVADLTTKTVGPASIGVDLTDYNNEKAVIDTDDWEQDTVPEFTATEATDWEIRQFFEYTIWPRFLEVEAGTFQNSPEKERVLEGVLVAFGAGTTEAQTIANEWVPPPAPGAVKPKWNELGITVIPSVFRDIEHVPNISDIDSLPAAIADWRTKFPRDIGRAFESLMMMREDRNGGWKNIYIRVTNDGFTWAGAGRTDPDDVTNVPAHYDWEIVSTASGVGATLQELLKSLYDSAEDIALKG